MKTQRLLTWICILCLFTVYVACQRDDYGAIPDPPPGPAVSEKVQTTVEGRIVDDQQVPVQGAIIRAGAATTFTDLNGNFLIRNVILDESAGFVKVEKKGFFTGSRTFKSIKDSKHFVTIQLIKKNDAGNFNGTAGGSITVPNGGSISFEANSVIDPANNTAYTGTVSVSAFLIDPTSNNFREIMPGELRGVDENNKQVGLQSFGMMAVEMTGASGQKLQLAPGKPATLTFPIPAALQASAAPTIAFWSFNDTTGLWKQEGYATKQGNDYCGKTSHFSFWNCDVPFPLVNFKVKLKAQDGTPAKNIKVLIKTTDIENGPSANSYTDTAGIVEGFVPSGRPLAIKIFSKCGEDISTQNIGPLNGATDLGEITINVPPDYQLTFTGTIQDCSGAPVQTGYADIFYLGRHERAPVLNGVLDYSYIGCANTNGIAKMRVTDAGNNVIGDLLDVNVVSAVGQAGEVKVCEVELTEYLTYTMDTIKRTFLPNPLSSLELGLQFNNVDTWTLYRDYDPGPFAPNYFILSFIMPRENSVPSIIQLFRIEVRQDHYISEGPVTLNFTEVDHTTKFVTGTFSATMVGPDSKRVPVSGKFRCRYHYYN